MFFFLCFKIFSFFERKNSSIICICRKDVFLYGILFFIYTFNLLLKLKIDKRLEVNALGVFFAR